MKYNILGYLIGEGFKNVFKNKKSSISCIVIMCATMLIFGIFFVLGQNIEHIIENVKAEQGMEVFILGDTSQEDIEKLREQIQQIEGVNTIRYKSKEDALNQVKEQFKDKQHLLDGMYIFDPSYVVTLTDLTLNAKVQEEILQLEHVKKITSSDTTISTLVTVANGIKIVTITVLILLILISIFIISNTIKLTVHARRKEISIMKYVGATNSFIRWPFLVEGIIIGLISGALSILLIGVLYNSIANYLMGLEIMDKIHVTLLGFNEMFNQIVIVYLILGVGVGVIGSMFSMKKYLEV